MTKIIQISEINRDSVIIWNNRAFDYEMFIILLSDSIASFEMLAMGHKNIMFCVVWMCVELSIPQHYKHY